MVNITMNQGVFTPVGATSSTPFSGTYFGGNHSVTNLVMANNTSTLRGLFGAVYGGYIDSLTIDMEDSSIRFVDMLTKYNKNK